MKKNLFVVILLVLFSGCVLAACSPRSSVSASFNKSQYTLSIDGEPINFYDELSVKGVKKEDIQLFSTNANIVDSFDSKTFQAVSGGKSYIIALYENNMLAKALVNVNYKLSDIYQPVVDEQGNVSWNPSYVVLPGGKKVEAEEYQVTLTNEKEETKEFTLSQPSFQLETEGMYSIKLKATTQAENIDDSSEFTTFLSYGYMDALTGFAFTSNEEFGQTLTLSWDALLNANYDIALNGLTIKEDLNTNNYTFDLSRYSGNVEIQIVAKDIEGKKKSSTTTVEIKVLDKPTLSYSDGELICSNDTDASSQVARVESLANGQVEYVTLDSQKFSLNGFESGMYKVNLISLGGQSDLRYHVNSALSEELEVFKLPQTQSQINFDERNLILTLDSTLAKNYRALIDNAHQDFQDVTTSLNIDISSLKVGKHTLSLIEMPKASDEITIDDVTTSNIICSDGENFEFYIIEEFGEITHSLTDESSSLIFEALDFANDYSVLVNGEELEYQVDEKSDKVKITFNLKDVAPNNDKYVVTLSAKRIEEENLTSIIRMAEKELTILDKAQLAEEQEEGKVTWQAVENATGYVVEIYKTDSSYNEIELISKETIEETSVTLPSEGYFKVKIISISQEEDHYLRSDFYDKENLLEKDLIITKQIQTPSVVFDENTQNSLNITGVKNCSEYEIYVDGVLDGSKTFNEPSENIEFTYKLANSMSEPKNYKIEVIAKSGAFYDNIIYLDSEKVTMTVIRLDEPAFTLEDIFDEFDALIGTRVNVEQMEGCKNIEFILNGSKLASSEFSLDMIDKTKFGSEFSLGLQAKADKSHEENVYYIDSAVKETNFQRVKAPSKIKYSAGDISITNDARGDKLYISVALVGDTNYYSRFFTEGLISTFDLQAYIDSHRADKQFDTAYRHADHIEVEIINYQQGFDAAEEIYYLPSLTGTTTTGLNNLVINQLEMLSPICDNEMSLVWESEVVGSEFDIYVDDEFVLTSSLTKIGLADIINDLTLSHKLQVIARADGYLKSDISSPIYAKQIKAPSELIIEKNDEGYVASIVIDNDSALIEKVEINGGTNNVSYVKGGNVVAFDPSVFMTQDFKIVYKAIAHETNNYYFDSAEKFFTLIDLNSQDFELELKNQELIYSEVATDITGNNIWPIDYRLLVTNSGNTYVASFEEHTNVKLDELEEVLKEELVGDVRITAQAIVNKLYTLSLNNSAIGYYGSHSSTEVQTQKLEEVGEVSILVVDATKGSLIQQKMNASLKLSFEDKWASLSNVKFEIALGDQKFTLPSFLFDFKKANGVYTLTISSTLMAQAQAGRLTATVQVKRAGDISSKLTPVDITKYPEVQNASITDQGILTIDDRATAYAIEVLIEDHKYETTIDNLQSLDLTTSEILGGKEGDYKVNIVGFDSDKKILASKTIFTLNGHKMQGIQNMELNDEGKINMTLYLDSFEDIIFTARYGEHEEEFEAYKLEESENIFYAYAIDIANMLELPFGENTVEISVKRVGSIDSDFKPISFVFSEEESCEMRRTASQDEDYIIFALDENILSARVAFIANFDETKREEIFVEKADMIKGYWVSGQNQGYFTQELGDETSANYQPCFGININSLLSACHFDYGYVTARVSKFGKEDKFIQYSSCDFDLYKLCPVGKGDTSDNLFIKNDVLSINWTQIDEEAGDKTATAYMIYITNKSGGVTKYKTYVPSFDLSQVNFIEGQDYQIDVKVISYESNIISSDLSGNPITTTKFTTPLSLEIENGRLQFNKEGFKESEYFKDIANFFGETRPTDYLETIKEKTYTSPYYFRLVSSENHNVTLCFTKDDYTYNVQVPVYRLFPDIDLDSVKNTDYTNYGKKSYISLLAYYAEKIKNQSSDVAANYLVQYINNLASSEHGIGDFNSLIDDYARDLPAGQYKLKIKQMAKTQYVSSDYSAAIDVYISPAPQIELDTMVAENSTDYIVRVTPSNTLIDGAITTAIKYKLQFRLSSDVTQKGISCPTLDFILLYESGNWTLSYKDLQLDEAVVQDGNSFILNMSKLKKLCSDIKNNENYLVDIFTYACDNDSVLNGKSGRFELQYLELRSDSISFKDGKFIIENTSSSQREVIIRYSGQGSGTITKHIDENNRAEIDLEKAGNYSTIVLSFNGSISSRKMNVESSTYLIRNVYKLNAPELSVRDSAILIASNLSDRAAVGGMLSFKLGNDVSIAEGVEQENKGYYYTSEKMSTTEFEYRPGLIGIDEYLSELSASEYLAFLCGNSGIFEESDGNEIADYILTFIPAVDSTANRPVLSSDINSLKAKIIAGIDSFEISDGHIKILNEQDYSSVLDNEKNQADILYEVEVSYYVKDNFAENDEEKYTFSYSEVLYMQKNLDMTIEYLDSRILDFNYNYYTFKITAIAAKELAQEEIGCITTVDGRYFTNEEDLFNEDVGTHALRSSPNKGTKTITYSRASTPYYQTQALLVRNGSINFVLNKNEVQAQDDQTTISRISVYVDYTAGGIDKNIKLEGEFTISTSSQIGDEEKLFVSFIPFDGQLNDALTSFVIKVYVHGIDSIGNNTLTSNPLVIRDVYKLAPVDKYYEITIIDGETYLDFGEYFENVEILNNRNYYKIVINFEMTDGTSNEVILTYSSMSKMILLSDNISKVKVYVTDGQDAMQSDPKRVLSSDTITREIKVTSAENLNINWNNNLKSFVWKWSDENENKYIYHIDLTILSKKESVDTMDNYYYPRNRGVISSSNFKVYARLISENPEDLYIFSDAKSVAEGGEIQYLLFQGGNGSQENPYQIATIEDFKNIALRNTEEFYFKLIADLDIKLSEISSVQEGIVHPFLEEFKAHLDGNHHSLNITLDNVYELTTPFVQNLIGKSDLKFEYFSSLFLNLASGSEIKNLDINYSVKFANLNNHSVMFAPLCAYNYGKVENVNITEASVSLNGTGLNNVFVCGVAAVNYGEIRNCVSYSNSNIDMPQKLTANFGYAAITLFNINQGAATGSVINCFNKGNVSVNVATTNTLVYVGGISIHSSGIISMCGNDGNLSLQTKAGGISCTGYYSGITITSSNGKLAYLYNNGTISKNASGQFNFAGISYRIRGGSINTLVETADQAITRNFENSPTDSGANYAGSNSNTAANMNVQELTEKTISADEGKTLSITALSGDKFTAKIV